MEPVYLRAEQGQLPELKRVIVVYDQSVVMENSLEEALNAIFGGEQVGLKTPAPLSGQAAALMQSALEAYRKSQAALRQGNWSEYGRYQQDLERILQGNLSK